MKGICSYTVMQLFFNAKRDNGEFNEDDNEDEDEKRER